MTTQNLPSTRRLVAHDDALAAERRRLLKQRTIPDRQVAADHAAVAVDQAVGDAVYMLGKRPRAWGWFA